MGTGNNTASITKGVGTYFEQPKLKQGATQEEIETACQILTARMKALGKGAKPLLVLPVYSALPSEMQTKIVKSFVLMTLFLSFFFFL